jgi:uncharacterized protein YecT (DUF1311 family)
MIQGTTRKITVGRVLALSCALLLSFTFYACLPLPAEPPPDSRETKQAPAQNSPRGPGQTRNEAGVGEEPCAKHKSPADRRACLQREFAAADAQLNAVYKTLRSQLGEPIRGELQENSRGWIQMKEYNCEFQAEMMQNVGDDTRQAEFYRCALAYTTERTHYLGRAFGRAGVGAGLTGEYDDGFAGNLKFKQSAKKDTYKFQIAVVRGPTAHIGEIDGEVFIPNGESGVYEERPDCSGIKEAALKPRAEPCCRLDFRLKNRKGFVRSKSKKPTAGTTTERGLTSTACTVRLNRPGRAGFSLMLFRKPPICIRNGSRSDNKKNPGAELRITLVLSLSRTPQKPFFIHRWDSFICHNKH